MGRGLCSLFVVALGMAASAGEEGGAETAWSWDLSPTLDRALEVMQLVAYIQNDCWIYYPYHCKEFPPMSSLSLPCSTQTWCCPEVEY